MDQALPFDCANLFGFRANILVQGQLYRILLTRLCRKIYFFQFVMRGSSSFFGFLEEIIYIEQMTYRPPLSWMDIGYGNSIYSTR